MLLSKKRIYLLIGSIAVFRTYYYTTSTITATNIITTCTTSPRFKYSNSIHCITLKYRILYYIILY